MIPLERPVGKPIRCIECRGTGYAEPAHSFTFGNDCPVCRGEGWLAPPAMDPLTRLARAVLLFHSGHPWTGSLRNEWMMLTGETEATTKVLCDLARRLLVEDEETAA